MGLGRFRPAGAELLHGLEPATLGARADSPGPIASDPHGGALEQVLQPRIGLGPEWTPALFVGQAIIPHADQLFQERGHVLAAALGGERFPDQPDGHVQPAERNGHPDQPKPGLVVHVRELERDVQRLVGVLAMAAFEDDLGL